ncbi:glycosyltransferase [Patescibacteria group bacterium]|nr:glycosyltransferase [Patescibacteria group bacterium]
MKIALINNLYHNQKRGGAEIIIEKLKHALEEKGHDCFVISTAPKKIIENKINNNQRKKEEKDISKNNDYLINSIYYNLHKFPYIIRLLWHLYKQIENRSVNKIKSVLKHEKPDLIISHNLTGFSIKIYKLIEDLNISHIHYLHDIQMLHPSGRMIYEKENIINSFFARLYQKIQKKYSQKVDLIVSPSKWLLKIHQDKGFFKNTKVWQKFNPIENINIKNINKNSKSNFTFIYIGQIDKDKGVEIMIKSFLKTANNSAKLRIIGDGKDLKTLKQKYYKHKNIIFLGRLSYQESMQKLAEANTLILPSLIYENSPTALFDALKLNIDIIATNLGGNTEIIKKYYGQLIKPNNINALSNAISNSLNSINSHKKPVNLSDLQVDIYIQELLKQLHLS